MINTQIASHLTPGSVTWLFYADRLMEFPTALLGVALGVVLTPQLAAAKAAGDAQRIRHARLGSAHGGAAGRALRGGPADLCHAPGGHAVPLRRLHRQRRAANDAMPWWGMGPVCWAGGHQGAGAGLITPARTSARPVKIAMVVLVFTQLLNLALVPFMAHAGLALSIGLGALVNATVVAGGAAAPRQLPAHCAGLG
jgi:putative peptidoglycan lipid II flippase